MSLDHAIEGLARRDRTIVLGTLALVVVLAWGYLLAGAGMRMSAFEMTRLSADTSDMAMMTPALWDLGYAWVMFVMWWVMMIAMMLPSAAPMLLLFASVNRRQRQQGLPYVALAFFASAYLVVWAGFSGIAVTVQWGLDASGLLSPMLHSASATLGGGLLLAAGLYQLTPLKQACLTHCRSPLQFMMTRWQTGRQGAFRMGVEHGAYCVGCCWFLMGLLFVGGVMNLFWIIGLAVFVLMEKTVPARHWLSYGVGVVLIVCGIVMSLEAV